MLKMEQQQQQQQGNDEYKFSFKRLMFKNLFWNDKQRLLLLLLWQIFFGYETKCRGGRLCTIWQNFDHYCLDKLEKIKYNTMELTLPNFLLNYYNYFFFWFW